MPPEGQQGMRRSPPGRGNRRNGGESSHQKAIAKHELITLFGKAQTARRRGDLAIARKLLSQCLRLDEGDAHSWLALAQLEARASNEARARSLFKRGRDACPNNVRLVQAHGVFEMRCGEAEAARECFALAAQMEPSNAYVCHSWGQLEEAQGNPDEARAIYKRCVSACAHAPIYSAWAALEAHQGDVEAARAVYESSCASASAMTAEEHAGLLLEWAALEQRAERLHAARKCVSEARALLPLSPRVMLAEAQLEWLHGKHALARKLLASAVRPKEEEGAIGDREEAGAAAAGARGRGAYGRGVQGRGSRGQRGAPGRGAYGDRATEGAKRGIEFSGGALHGKAKLRQEYERELTEVYNGWAALESKLEGEKGFNRALAVIDEGLARLPFDGSLHQTRGALLHRLGRTDEAREAFRVSARRGGGAPAYVAWALLEEACGDADAAEELFARGARADAHHAPLHHARASFELRRGDASKAKSILVAACARTPTATLWHGLGQLQLRKGDVDEAEALFTKGAKLGRGLDRTSYLWHSLGIVRLKQRRLPEARDAFQRGLQRTAGCSQLLLGVAMVEAQMGNPKEAREYFRRAVDADSTHAHAWQAWGVMESRLTNTDSARTLFARGLRECPRHVALWQAAAKLEADQGNVKRARSLYKLAERRCAPTPADAIAPDADAETDADASTTPNIDADVVSNAVKSDLESDTLDADSSTNADIAAKADNATKADSERAADSAVAGGAAASAAVHADYVSLLLSWASFELHDGKLAYAQMLLARARAHSPSKGEFYHLQALLLIKQGSVKDARQTLEEGLRVDSRHVPLYRVLGSLLDAANEVEAARKVFKDGLRLQPNYAQIYHAWARLEARLLNWEGLAELNTMARREFPPDNLPPLSAGIRE